MWLRSVKTRVSSTISASQPIKNIKDEGPTLWSDNGVFSPSKQGKMLRIKIPLNAMPGSYFKYFDGERVVLTRCPLNFAPGMIATIYIPNDPDQSNIALHTQEKVDSYDIGAFSAPLSAHVVVNDQTSACTKTGRRLLLSFLQNRWKRILVRTISCKAHILPSYEMHRSPQPSTTSSINTNMFEVIAPQGYKQGIKLLVAVARQSVILTCPPNTLPGDRICFFHSTVNEAFR